MEGATGAELPPTRDSGLRVVRARVPRSRLPVILVSCSLYRGSGSTPCPAGLPGCGMCFSYREAQRRCGSKCQLDMLLSFRVFSASVAHLLHPFSQPASRLASTECPFRFRVLLLLIFFPSCP